MKRNLRVLGLTLVAAFAMSALVASAAQAVKVTTAQSPAIITATDIGSKQKFVINPNTANPAELECTTLDGHATITTSGETEVTFTSVNFTTCTVKIGATSAFATVDIEGCDFKFHGGVKDGEHHWKEGEVDLVCPGATTGPVITIFSDAEHKTRICKYTVWNFTNKKEITYTNTTGTPDDVDLKAVNVPISVTRNEGILCPKPDESAIFNGETTLEAFEDLGKEPLKEGKQIGLTIS